MVINPMVGGGYLPGYIKAVHDIFIVMKGMRFCVKWII